MPRQPKNILHLLSSVPIVNNELEKNAIIGKAIIGAGKGLIKGIKKVPDIPGVKALGRQARKRKLSTVLYGSLGLGMAHQGGKTIRKTSPKHPWTGRR